MNKFFSRVSCGSPEVFVCDLVDILTKQLFGGMLEDVFQEALRASALMSHQRSVSRFPQSAFGTQVRDYVTNLHLPAFSKFVYMK